MAHPLKKLLPVRLPLLLKFFLVGLLVPALFAPNFLLTVFALAVFLVIVNLHWRPKEPPYLFFALLMDWLQASIQIFNANFYGRSLASINQYRELNVTASWLSLIAVLVLAVGIYVYKRRTEIYFERSMGNLDQAYAPRQVFKIYVAITLVLLFGGNLAWAFPRISQIIIMLMKLKWGFLVAAVVLTEHHPALRRRLWLFVIFEMVMGFTSFFSNFKEVLIFSFIGLLPAIPRMSLKRQIRLAALAVFILSLGVVWQGIKGPYREFLKQGKVTQTRQVSRKEALNKFTELAMNLNAAQLELGFKTLVDRIGNTPYFAAALAYVPHFKPHQHGRLWGEAFDRLLRPRLFFPNKPAIADSKQLNEFTGLNVAGTEQATSISLSLVAGSYVDFGLVGMFVPIFLFGVLAGYLYYWIIRKSGNIFWAIVLGAPFFYLIPITEQNIARNVTALFIYLVTALLFQKFLLKKIDPFLRRKVKVRLQNIQAATGKMTAKP
ncbi:MAG: hypothetical protein D6732_05730 [Methanobacteriota archaeon]|nr:MAG: hypothetical protein D6732_05730 [Euryarchaeota archaeon]